MSNNQVYNGTKLTYLHQAVATLNQNNPTSGTYYTILDTVFDAEIIAVQINTTWTVQPDPLSLRVTIDGNVLVTQQANPVSTTKYYIYQTPYTSAVVIILTTTSPTNTLNLKGHSIKVETAVTGGTVQNLAGIVIYLKRV